jgi:UDP-GlcNAc:undecaprenyl-phosphate/decaprenyl-phosphate GlcNAc-1-phosphate transferase
MLTYLVAFLLSAATSLVLTPVAREVAHRRGWLDDPESEARKVHDRAIPRVGGLAIAIAFFVPLIGLFLFDNHVSRQFLEHPSQVLGLLVGAAAMVALGFADDVYCLGAKQKFAVQFTIATAVYFLGFQIDRIANPFGEPIDLVLLSYPLTMLWIVGITNAINLIDGLDGLAGGVSLFSVVTIFVLSLIYPNYIAGITAIALAGALTGFLRYNFNPASIFMGDSGSLFLGFVLSTTSILSSTKSSTAVALAIPVLALGLPIMDTGMAVVRRFMGGRPLFKGDRQHIHHRLLDAGFAHRQAVLLLYGATALCGLVALALVWATETQAAFLLALFGAATIGTSRALGYLDMAKMSLSLRYGLMRQPQLRRHIGALDRTAQDIRTARTMDEALACLAGMVEETDMAELKADFTIRTTKGTRQYATRLLNERIGQQASDRDLRFGLDWELGDVAIDGEIYFRWGCDEAILQLPEAPVYEWLAMVLRDRALELAREAAASPSGLRVAPTGLVDTTS